MRKTGGRRGGSEVLPPRGAFPSTESHTCLGMSGPRATLGGTMLSHRFHTPYYDYRLRIPTDQIPGDRGGEA